MSAPTELISKIDRSLPPLLINGQQHANNTTLTVDPAMALWLSSEACLRITSALSFIHENRDKIRLDSHCFYRHCRFIRFPATTST
jgi:hypothetical protein